MNGVINEDTEEVTYYSFNAWGVPRDPGDWTAAFEGELFADRGFTGHEHLPDFNLINMPARRSATKEGMAGSMIRWWEGS